MPKPISIEYVDNNEGRAPHVLIRFDNNDAIKIDIRDGLIRIAAMDGTLIVKPYSTNVVDIAVEEWRRQ